jgi:hypothetical protein
VACDETRTPSQHFVAARPPPRTIATFVPYSQHFVARPTIAATIETKRWLPGALPSRQLMFVD